MTLEVSVGSLIALGLLLVVCFLLPIGLFYALYQLSEGNFKMFGIGAAAYFVLRFIIELPTSAFLEHFAHMREHPAIYAVYLLLICPLFFVAVHFIVLKFFGNHIETTGHALLYLAGYVTLQNIVEVGFVSAWYFVTLLSIRSAAAQYTVVSEGDYVSMSEITDPAYLVTDGIFAEMQQLCGMTPGYFLSLCAERLWIIVAYSAIVLVVWLSMRKGRILLPVLGFAFVMRMLASLPAALNVCGVLPAGLASGIVTAIVLIILCVMAVFCWRRYIDDAPAH